MFKISISKSLDIKIVNGQAKLSEKFYVYQNDRGIELRLKVNLSKFSFKSNYSTYSGSDEEIFVGATILKPNRAVLSREKILLKDSIIRFRIDEDITDEIDEIGVYTIQFHLYDNENGRITLPPVEFEVKELIGKVFTSEDGVAIVDESEVDNCVIEAENRTIDIFVNGKYIKTYWSRGDLISAERLNKIETALETFDNRFGNFLNEEDTVDISKLAYSNPSDINISSVKDALDKLLYFDLSISLSSSVATTLEKGFVVEAVVFNWTYNKEIVSQTFMSIPLDKNGRNYRYTTEFSTNKTFTLTANDGVKNFSKSISFSFLNGRYWGVSNVSEYNSDFIKTLSKELSSSRNKTFTVNCGEGQHIFYCIPTNFGTPTFTVGGFSGGFSKVSTIQYSNIHGHVESYDIWKSTNSNLGNTTVVVS